MKPYNLPSNFGQKYATSECGSMDYESRTASVGNYLIVAHHWPLRSRHLCTWGSEGGLSLRFLHHWTQTPEQHLSSPQLCLGDTLFSAATFLRSAAKCDSLPALLRARPRPAHTSRGRAKYSCSVLIARIVAIKEIADSREARLMSESGDGEDCGPGVRTSAASLLHCCTSPWMT